MQERSNELAKAGQELASWGVDELESAAVAANVAKGMAAEGVGEVVEGAADLGASETMSEVAEALKESEDQNIKLFNVEKPYLGVIQWYWNTPGEEVRIKKCQ